MTRAASVILLLALVGGGALAGCAPALLWYGHDPTRATRWELRANEGKTWIESGAVGGTRGQRQGAAYDEVVVAHLVFDEQGRRYAFPARRGDRWHMIVDGREGGAWDGVTSPRFSAKGQHFIYLAEQAGHWHVVRDGIAGEGHRAIVEGTLTLSSNGARLGYAATDGAGGCIRVFVDSRPPSDCYQQVRALFVGDRRELDLSVVEVDGASAVVRDTRRYVIEGLGPVAFEAREGDWAAVSRVDGKARIVDAGIVEKRSLVGTSGVPTVSASDQGPLNPTPGTDAAPADEIAGLTFTPTGELAYAAREADTWRFVLNGRAGPAAYRSIDAVSFSASGKRHGYVARLADGRAAVVIDGRARGAWSSAAGLVFSGDDRRAAWAVRAGGDTAIVCDGGLFPFDVVIESSIGFSADGRHWGAVVGDRRRRQLSIVVDGKHHLPFDSAELFGAAAEQAADAGGLRRWVTAELDRRNQREGSAP